MYIKELSVMEYTNYELNHALSSFYQTVNYGVLMAENTHDYDLIGYVDESGNIYAASMIIIKKIGTRCLYGYAPRGFLIDYSNMNLLNNFTEDLKKYYKTKGVAFIKINPEIAIGEVNNKTFETAYNINRNLVNNLDNAGYNKLKDNLYFEAMLPRFNAYVKSKDFSLNNLNKNTKNKIKKGIRKGLVFECVSKDNLDIFYNFIKNKKERSINYYKDYYTVFDRDNSIKLYLVKIDYNRFLINSRQAYEEEFERNNHYNELMIKSNSAKLINKKMQSDKTLLSYKNDILESTKGVQENKEVYIAGALVVTHKNKASIVMSGFDQNYKRFAPNYFLHYNIIKEYYTNYDFIDLNGLTGDFTPTNPYSGLNRFKLGFNPKIYEFIGEYDLVIDDLTYKMLLRTGALAKEFNKK